MKKACLFAITILSAIPKVVQSADVCRALALSGGGNKGAWEAGIIHSLMHSDRLQDFQYDVVSGVSAGAINAGGMGVWPKGTEVMMSEWLSEAWQNLTSDQIYKEWTGGYLAGILYKPSIYNTQPALDFLTDLYGSFATHGYDIPTREIIVSAVDVETGVYTQFDNSQPLSQWPHSILASASIPFMFPPTTINGEIYMDGGTAWNSNLASAVQKCYEMVGDYTKITLDIANCDFHEIVEEEDTSRYALSNYLRSLEIHKITQKNNDVIEFIKAYPDVNFRYYFLPSGNVTSGLDGLDFANSTTFYMQEMGREDAQEAISYGDGFGFKLLEDYHDDQQIQDEHKSFSNYYQYIKDMLYTN